MYAAKWNDSARHFLLYILFGFKTVGFVLIEEMHALPASTASSVHIIDCTSSRSKLNYAQKWFAMVELGLSAN